MAREDAELRRAATRIDLAVAVVAPATLRAAILRTPMQLEARRRAEVSTEAMPGEE